MREFRHTMTRHLSDPSSPSRKPRKRRDPKTIDGRGPDDRLERSLFELGHRFVAGVDEAGRGPLAGPVVAAAVVLDMDRVPEGLDDSKKLSATERERLFDAVLATSTVSVGTASAAEIDRINIRQATFNAMRRAVSGLAQRPCHALIDGRDLPSALGCEGSAVIGGDALSLSIAAASIVAKVTRDRMMRALCIEHPAYGFGTHMGYGTPAHLAAIGAHGPCFHHRRSFAPIRNRVLQTGLA